MLGILIATYRDIKIREVPDTVSYGLIIIGLLGGLCIAILEKDVMIFLQHLAGFGIGALIGTIMYYTRQWGGGDAKLMMGVGAIIGFWLHEYTMIAFFFLLIICGAIYGVVVTLWLALITHRKKFLPAFAAIIRNPKVHKTRIILVITGVLLIIASFFVPFELKMIIGFALLAMYLFTYAWIFSKAAEQSIFIKEYKTSKLTEGDWIAKDVKIGKKVIVSKDTPGITKEQIALLKKKGIKTVTVKEGIPFVPAFLFAYILLLILQYTIGMQWFLGLF
jgi:Flp pilus assembly protein protease CpaA